MKSGEFIEKIGRRKTSTARVRLFTGSGNSIINGKPVNEYVSSIMRRGKLALPFTTSGLSEKDYYYTVITSGGGETGQVDAIILGLSRILASMDLSYKAALKKKGLLTRDPRMVERKKPYFVKARKRPQYSKR